MRKGLLVWSLVLCVATLLGGQAAFAGENWVGTWKLNEAKSKLSSGGVRAQTLKFEATPAGIKLTSEGTDAQGQPMHGGYTSKFDGKEMPWAGNPMADTASPKRIDDNTYENVWKKAGKAGVTAKVSVSKDGKTLTVTQTGADAQGAVSTTGFGKTNPVGRRCQSPSAKRPSTHSKRTRSTPSPGPLDPQRRSPERSGSAAGSFRSPDGDAAVGFRRRFALGGFRGGRQNCRIRSDSLFVDLPREDTFGFLGEPRVNVLLLNLDLNERLGGGRSPE